MDIINVIIAYIIATASLVFAIVKNTKTINDKNKNTNEKNIANIIIWLSSIILFIIYVAAIFKLLPYFKKNKVMVINNDI